MIDTGTFPADQFKYVYLAGPVDTPQAIDVGVSEGNCRYALQLYYYRMHNKFYERDEIYLPGGYKVLGEFIFKEEQIDFSKLKQGDIVFAQNLRNKEGKVLEKGIENYETKDKWLYYLHSAIYLGKIDPNTEEKYIWHATNIEGGPTLWTLEKFQHYYLPVSAKRVFQSQLIED